MGLEIRLERESKSDLWFVLFFGFGLGWYMIRESKILLSINKTNNLYIYIYSFFFIFFYFKLGGSFEPLKIMYNCPWQNSQKKLHSRRMEDIKLK